jgi:tetratricopeptide (TPR) repeat protein
LFICYAWQQDIVAQAWSFNLKKPQKYEDKKLPSEKTEEKKWTLWRKFTQNGVTKFNWHFNARERLEQALDRAKASYRDDYTKLLSFYNYDLEATAADGDIDSVLYKANAGILIHDLRNAWIDNLYMIMGQAWYYKKVFDTAYLSFQYVNYAFAPKEKDGYDLPIGSNATEGGNAFSISTKEDNRLPKRVWSSPPSRNESFIWQVRTHIAKNEMPEAASLIETLRSDPNFPARLQPDLREVQALYFYTQEMWDSAAHHLEFALDKASNKEEKARWEFLIGQLYEKAGNFTYAADFYGRAVNRTLNPVLEVYGRLNSIRMQKGDDKVINENIEALLKMGRRERYMNYRDLIYFTAAQIELERNNIEAAKQLLLLATRYKSPESDNSQISKAWIQLGDIAYGERKYAESKSYYDSSTTAAHPVLTTEAFADRKSALGNLVLQESIIARQDSLQQLAALPEAEREAIIKKLARKLRKQQGLKEEENTGEAFVNPAVSNNNNSNQPAADLFAGASGADSKGEWYFQNQGLKGKGFTAFKSKWGNRKNVDNWRRASAIAPSTNNAPTPGDSRSAILNPKQESGKTEEGSEFTYEGLLKNVPLTEAQMSASNDSIEQAQLKLGIVLQEGITDYLAAIDVLEGWLQKFPYSNKKPEALFHLYYCYSKLGMQQKANAVAQELKQKYPGTDFEKIVSHPKGDPKENAEKTAATRKYESIYNLFIEGNFAQALTEKKAADSIHGTNYWTPQLLYIESIYHIHERQDDTAKTVLQQIVSMFPSSPMATKAQNLIDVLGRRKEIEEYLTNLKIERPKDDSIMLPSDELAAQPKKLEPPKVEEEEQKIIPDKDHAASKIAGQKDAAKTKDSIAIKAPGVAPSTNVPGLVQKEKPYINPLDTLRVNYDAEAAKGKKAYVLDINVPYSVVIVMNKVDHVYVTETRNAFNRYNKTKFYNKPININNEVLNDSVKLVVMNSFENAVAALEYMDKARKAAPAEIPWLPAAKYSFMIITAPNMELLKETKDIDAYKKWLTESFPGRF